MSLPVIRHPAAPERGFYVYDPFDVEALRQPDMTGLEVELPLAELYERVEFPPAKC